MTPLNAQKDHGSSTGALVPAAQRLFPSSLFCVFTFLGFFLGAYSLDAQSLIEKEHRRGKLWETIRNDGWIGSLGAWDFLTPQPLGLYPGFEGYNHPLGNEFEAVDTYENCNFHNFRSGCWIVVKDMLIPGGPPTYSPTAVPFEVYASGLQGETYGVANQLEPIELRQNYIESPTFDPRLPEEMTDGFWYTNTGIRVTRRSYVWSFPGFSDFIIYDYEFKFTGEFVANTTRQLVPNPPSALLSQTLSNIYFAFHSGISVSTKSPINFHCELFAVAAGAFGWRPDTYHDYYHIFDNGELVFSRNFDGGNKPHQNSLVYCTKDSTEWKSRFGEELFSPAAFGWLALYASPLTAQPPRTSPRPDILRVDTHKGGSLQGTAIDLQTFRDPPNFGKSNFYTFATSPDTQAAVGNRGDRLNFFTFSYGPYTLNAGESVRIVLAEIAGVMDYHQVNGGDPLGHFPDSTIAAIRRNAENARKAVQWGLGATVNGLALAADVPEPPPPPSTQAISASRGSERAIIGITWDRSAETRLLTDGQGGQFYDGSVDLQGYRIYRSVDFQFSGDAQKPTFRGAAWTRIADIPRAQFTGFFDNSLQKYKFEDTTVVFGFDYVYYVSAYWTPTRLWTSANGTVVNNLPELESGEGNKTARVSAASGPIDRDSPGFFDIFVAPNPYVYDDPNRSFPKAKVEFRNLPSRCTIRVYTVMGDLIWQKVHQPDEQGNKYGSLEWNLVTDSNINVAPGLYIYHVEFSDEAINKTKTGKFVIIR